MEMLWSIHRLRTMDGMLNNNQISDKLSNVSHASCRIYSVHKTLNL